MTDTGKASKLAAFVRSLLFLVLFNGVILFFGFTACNNGSGSPEGGEVPNGNGSSGDGKVPTVINLTAEIGDEGEFLTSRTQIKLSDFTDITPQKGDDLKFKISGNVSMSLNLFAIGIWQVQGDNWDTFHWVGDSPLGDLPKSFEDHIITTHIWQDPVPNSVFYVDLTSWLWQKDAEGNYIKNSGKTFPQGVKQFDVMATISDFSISLVIDTPDNEDGEKVWADPIPGP